jgi:phage tail sheath protein FI
VSPNYLAPGIYLEETPAGSRPIQGVGTAVAAFVGLTESGPVGAPTLVSNWTAYRQLFGGFAPGCHLPRAIYGYFQNGGGSCYVVRAGAEAGEPVARAQLPSADDQSIASYDVSLAADAPEGTISVEVTAPADAGPDDEQAGGAAAETFDLIVRIGDREVERYESLSLGPGPQNAVSTVNQRSRVIRMAEAAGGAIARLLPAPGSVSLVAPEAPERPGPEAFVGDLAARTGLGALEAIDEVTMIAAPDVVGQAGETPDLDMVKAVQLEMIAQCEKLKDRMTILDPPPGLSVQAVHAWRMTQGYDSPFAALYWPWLRVPGEANGPVSMPPSGHVAGVWARSDAGRGVHKAPANEAIGGVLDVELQVTQEEQELLNPVGINAMRAFPARGIRIWGARTLAPADSEWRYLNVRRLLNYLEESIVEGTQWVVFEPNDQRLWQRIIRSVTAFLTLSWRDGALFGARPEDAFFVKCDAENNPPEVVDAGQVIIDIGVAPVKPAEFVVFRVAQLAGGAQISD